MATDQLINKSQGDAIIAGLTAIKNAINDQPVPTQVEDVVADAFDEGVAYVPGDYCIHENKLYICDAPHHGAWDGNDFTLTTVGAVLESLNNELSNVGKIQSGRTEILTMNSEWVLFTITMPENMPNTDYTIIATAENNVGSGDYTVVKYSERALNSFKIWVGTPKNSTSHNIFINWIAIAH